MYLLKTNLSHKMLDKLWFEGLRVIHQHKNVLSSKVGNVSTTKVNRGYIIRFFNKFDIYILHNFWEDGYFISL